MRRLWGPGLGRGGFGGRRDDLVLRRGVCVALAGCRVQGWLSYSPGCRHGAGALQRGGYGGRRGDLALRRDVRVALAGCWVQGWVWYSPGVVVMTWWMWELAW